MLYFVAAFIFSAVFTFFVKKVAWKFKIVDQPDTERRFHSAPVPLLGGVAIWLVFWIITFGLLIWNPIYQLDILLQKLFFVFLASTILVIVGIVDDIKRISAKLRLVLVAAAVLICLLGGLELDKLTNPLGGVINLKIWPISLGVLGTFYLLADLLVFFWLMGVIYTTKITDGLDGLATGIVTIGAFMIYFLSSSAKFYQPNVALLALIFAGVCLGFLVFNFYPAKIFLGESGGLFLGLMLGVLAVISGGKLATALLVMAVPILDLARVIYLRLRKGQPVFVGDRRHLYYQLLDSGWSAPKVVWLFYLVSILFGLTTLFLQSYQKLIALVFLFIAMLAVAWKLSEKK